MSTAGPVVGYFLIGLLTFILGMIHSRNIIAKKPDGIFYVDLQNLDEDPFKLQIDVPLEEIPKQKYLIFKVNRVS